MSSYDDDYDEPYYPYRWVKWVAMAVMVLGMAACGVSMSSNDAKQRCVKDVIAKQGNITAEQILACRVTEQVTINQSPPK